MNAVRTLGAIESKLERAFDAITTEVKDRGLSLVLSIETAFDNLTTNFDERARELLEEYVSTNEAVTKLIGNSDETATLAATIESMAMATEATQRAATVTLEFGTAFLSRTEDQLNRELEAIHQTLSREALRISTAAEDQREIFRDLTVKFAGFLPELKQGVDSALADEHMRFQQILEA